LRLTVKLYASLASHLSPEARSTNQQPIDVPEGVSVATVLAPFGLPVELVNGRYVAPEDRPHEELKDGDVVAVWPPIAGG
jgi:sulfur-carrier protein